MILDNIDFDKAENKVKLMEIASFNSFDSWLYNFKYELENITEPQTLKKIEMVKEAKWL